MRLLPSKEKFRVLSRRAKKEARRVRKRLSRKSEVATRGRRGSAIAVLRLAFAGPANASVWNWWPLPLWLAAAVLGLFRVQLPKLALNRAEWLAVFLGVCVALLFRAAYKLHAQAYPPFPLHRISRARPMHIPRDDDDDLFFVDITYTNRTSQQVILEMELMWERHYVNGMKMGPYRYFSVSGPIGSIQLTDQPVVVAPHDVTKPEVRLAFSAEPAFGVCEDENGLMDVEPGMRLFLRLTDQVTDAVTDVDLIRRDPSPPKPSPEPQEIGT